MKDTLLEQISQISEKELKIYQAIGLLIKEGRSINSLTVSEVTEKAGIGKGTAYGYFRSKEEMFAKAIHYGVLKCICDISDRVNAQPDFEKKYLEILNWMETIFYENNIAFLFYQLSHEANQITTVLKQELHPNICKEGVVHEKIVSFLQEGMQEGIISSDCPSRVLKYMMISNLGAFWMYLVETEQPQKADRDRFKAYLYRCLIQNLNMQK